MGDLKIKLLKNTKRCIDKIAMNTVNSASGFHIYQPKTPKKLQK